MKIKNRASWKSCWRILIVIRFTHELLRDDTTNPMHYASDDWVSEYANQRKQRMKRIRYEVHFVITHELAPNHSHSLVRTRDTHEFLYDLFGDDISR